MACFGTAGLVLLGVVLVDPYDAGRFPTFMPPGTSTDLPSTLNISRGRDPRFDAVALGDSRAVLIDGQGLSEGSGFRFAQLAVEGATVRDELVYLHWFARNHPTIGAIALMSGQEWCDRGPQFRHSSDFPSALYADSAVEYLRATLNTTSVRMMARRISYALGWSPGIDPRHFIDFEAKYPWRFAEPPRWRRSQGPFRPTSRDLPAMHLLEEVLARLPARPVIVLWVPPRYVDMLPPPDTVEGRELTDCKESLRAWAEQRPRTAFLDFAVDSALARARENFLDLHHPRRRLASVIETDMAGTFARLK